MVLTNTESASSSPAKLGPQTLLSIRNVAKSFGRTPVLRDISLQVAEGEFLTVLGESGSGKTTLLRIIAGVDTAYSGDVWMEGQRLDALPPYRRRVNTVFQHYALFPHLTVEENVGYGLKVARLPKEQSMSRLEHALAMVKMTAYAKFKPGRDRKSTRLNSSHRTISPLSLHDALPISETRRSASLPSPGQHRISTLRALPAPDGRRKRGLRFESGKATERTEHVAVRARFGNGQNDRLC